MHSISLTMRQFVLLADYAGIIIEHNMSDTMMRTKININPKGLCDDVYNPPLADESGSAKFELSYAQIKSIAEDFFMLVYSVDEDDIGELMFTLDEKLSFDDSDVGLAIFTSGYLEEGFVPLAERFM